MKRFLLLSFVAVLFACDSDQDKAGRFFLKGNEAMTKGEHQEAIRLYTEAIAKDDKYKEAWNNRGVANYKARRYVEAINDYTQILLQIDPEFVDARRNRVNAYLDAGRFDKAMEDLDVLENLYPDSAFVDFTRGLVYHEMKDFQSSINAFEGARVKSDKDAEVLINIANGYFMLKEMDRAMNLLEEAKTIDAEESKIYNTLALIELSKNEPNYDFALQNMNQALKFESNNPYFFNNRAFIYLMTDELMKAQGDLRLAIMGAPENAWAYRNRGILLYKREDYEAAIRNFQLAEDYDAKVPLMHRYWAQALLAQGKQTEACEVAKRSVDDLTQLEELKNLPCL